MLGEGISIGPIRDEGGMAGLGGNDGGIKVRHSDGIEEESVQ